MISPLQREDSDNRFAYQDSYYSLKDENTALFANSQQLSIPANSLDLVFMFKGDINEHKIFSQRNYIEEFFIRKCTHHMNLSVIQDYPEILEDDEMSI